MNRGHQICSVCSRSDADAIDRALAVEGSSRRGVARKFGLGRSAVNRHASRHLAARLRKAAEDRAAGSDPRLLDEVLELNRLTKGILAKAYNSGDLKTALVAVARAEKQIELQARLLGLLREGTTNNVVALRVDEATGRRVAEAFLARLTSIETQSVSRPVNQDQGTNLKE